VGLGEGVLVGRTEVGVEVGVGGFVEEVVVVVVVRVELLLLLLLLLLLPEGKEEVPELTELEEAGQLVVAANDESKYVVIPQDELNRAYNQVEQ